MDQFIIQEIPLQFSSAKYGNTWYFYSANEAASFMWGKSAGKYCIYKNGRLAYLSHLYLEVTALEKYLEYVEGDNENGRIE